jgi:serine/threonine protein kinase
VTVLKHGHLINSPYYFIDMELCQTNLETYIYCTETPEFMEKLYCEDTKKPQNGVLWKILHDMAQGLEFIHQLKEIHRDLKPRNGASHEVVSYVKCCILDKTGHGKLQISDWLLKGRRDMLRLLDTHEGQMGIVPLN